MIGPPASAFVPLWSSMPESPNLTAYPNVSAVVPLPDAYAALPPVLIASTGGLSASTYTLPSNTTVTLTVVPV